MCDTYKMKDTESVRNNEASEEPAVQRLDTSNSSTIGGAQDKDSYKTRKKKYQKEKKKIAEQLLTTLNDPTTLVLADWLKVRATIKAWYKVWCELRPGLLVVYKSQKTHKYGQWIGTVLLSVCQVIERPSRKDGICLKLFNPLEQNIWASKGPKGETFGAITMPLPLTSLMIRVSSKAFASRWIEAMQLSVQCSKRIIRNTQPHRNTEETARTEDGFVSEDEEEEEEELCVLPLPEKHSAKSDHELSDDPNSSAEHEFHSSDSDTGNGPVSFDRPVLKVRKHFAGSKSMLKTIDSLVPEEFRQVLMQFGPEKHSFKHESQVGAFGEENKSLMWAVLKQVRPGMDLSKVVLPTFILEPRSFLEKLSDYYYHCDILSEATIAPFPLDRLKLVLKFYLSGFYKKPNGLKKPYNPILGEVYRCMWDRNELSDTCSMGTSSSSSSQNCSSRTYYLAEQISHHPPCSAFYAINPYDGFQITGVVLVKSKFFGNAVSAILDGQIRLRLLGFDEEYTITLPYAYCKGIVFGSLSFELGGKIGISCSQTGYSTDLEFKLKPYFGGEMNVISGKIRCHGRTLASVEGHWDQSIYVIDKETGHRETLWQVDESTPKRRLKRFTVPLPNQEEMESERLWRSVTEAIENSDQHLATIEKTKLEDQQRNRAKQLLEKNEKHKPRYFVLTESGEWVYKHDQQLRSLVYNRLQSKQLAQKKMHKHKEATIKEQQPISIVSLDARLLQMSEQLQNLSKQQNELFLQMKDQTFLSSTFNAFTFKDVLLSILFALITQFLIKFNLNN